MEITILCSCLTEFVSIKVDRSRRAFFWVDEQPPWASPRQLSMCKATGHAPLPCAICFPVCGKSQTAGVGHAAG